MPLNPPTQSILLFLVPEVMAATQVTPVGISAVPGREKGQSVSLLPKSVRVNAVCFCVRGRNCINEPNLVQRLPLELNKKSFDSIVVPMGVVERGGEGVQRQGTQGDPS